MLLAPERGLLLDDTAAKIVGLCDGSRTVAEIVDSLCGHYDATAPAIEADVERFLAELVGRGLVTV